MNFDIQNRVNHNLIEHVYNLIYFYFFLKLKIKLVAEPTPKTQVEEKQKIVNIHNIPVSNIHKLHLKVYMICLPLFDNLSYLSFMTPSLVECKELKKAKL